MAMPEATVHEDDCSRSGKNEIWRARQTSIVQSVPKAERMQTPPDDHLGACIARPNPRHVEAALL